MFPLLLARRAAKLEHGDSYYQPGSGVEFTLQLERKRLDNLRRNWRPMAAPPSQRNLKGQPWYAQFPDVADKVFVLHEQKSWCMKVFDEIFEAAEEHMKSVEGEGAAFFFTLPYEIKQIIGVSEADKLYRAVGMSPMDEAGYATNRRGVVTEFWLPWKDTVMSAPPPPLDARSCHALLSRTQGHAMSHSVGRRVMHCPSKDQNYSLPKVRGETIGKWN